MKKRQAKKAAKKAVRKTKSRSKTHFPPKRARRAKDYPAVGIIAPAGPIPQVELFSGAERIADAGFPVFLHPQVKKQHGFFAGSDTERALGFLDYAFDPEISVIWAARGGYGSIRILPILDEITTQVGYPSHKTLVGFSDATILLEYAKRKWGWRVLHGAMPATHHFERVKGEDWKNLVTLVQGKRKPIKRLLRPLFLPKGYRKVQGELAGGNLSTIVSALKTPYECDLQGKILFLEEVTESPYRMDRMLQQLALSGDLGGVRAIVLGELTHCEDQVPKVYATPPGRVHKPRLKPLRPAMNERQATEFVFGSLGQDLGIPVFTGMRVGHGQGTDAIELGVPTQIDQRGVIFV